VIKDGTATTTECTRFQKLGLTDNTVGVTKTTAVWLDLGHLGLVLLGWLIIAASSLVRARFWFDALSRLGSLRSTGPKPTSSVDK
jgi:hypothetical protein